MFGFALTATDPIVAIDEPAWISSASVTLRLLRTVAPPAEWNDAYDQMQLGDWGHRNPPVGKMVIGAGLALAGESTQPRLMWPDALPMMRALFPARLAIVAVAGVTLWLAYWFAWQLTGSPFALVAPLFLVALPVFRFHATHVYTDLPELCLMLGAAVLLVSRRFLGAAVAVGLACAVKFNAAPELLPIVVLATSARRWQAVLLAPAVAFAVFVAVNPYLYPNPIGRSINLVQEWRVQKALQQAEPSTQQWAVSSRREALALTTATVFEPARDARVIDHSLVRWLTTGLILVGFVVIRSRLWWLLFGTSFVATVLWLPFDWGRYYLPVIIWLPALIVIGLDRSSIIAGQIIKRPLPRAGVHSRSQTTPII